MHHERKSHFATPKFIAMVDKEISNWSKWFTQPVIQKEYSQKSGEPNKEIKKLKKLQGGPGALPFLTSEESTKIAKESGHGSNPLNRTGVYYRGD